jgi:hypothetical protein
MSAAEIVERAATLRVRLWIDRERINMAGPSKSVATIKPKVAAHKPEIMTYLRAAASEAADCAGALIDPDGGAYLPWGPYLSSKDMLTMRDELVALIDEPAARERWDAPRLNDVMSRALRGPLGDLLPNLHYFRERLEVLKAQEAAREAKERLSWRLDGFDDRHA